jgi:hypothetical protein
LGRDEATKAFRVRTTYQASALHRWRVSRIEVKEGGSLRIAGAVEGIETQDVAHDAAPHFEYSSRGK